MQENDAALAAELVSELESSMQALDVLRKSQNEGEAYDQLIAEGNDDGNAKVQAAINALITQTPSIERAVAML